MKDNQMKQAEREAFEKEFEIIGYPMKVSAWGTDVYVTSHIQQRWEGWQARAKLTTSQVSEPVGELCMDSQGFGAYKQIKTLPYGYHKLYTTPQEAISPAIAEYIKLLEKALLSCTDLSPYEQSFDTNLVDKALASKPTGLE